MNSEKKIEKIVDLMRRDDSADAPPETLKWAKNLIRTRAVEPKRTLLHKVIAVLQMDLSPEEAIFGERSAAGAQARQVLFRAGDSGIDLRIEKKGQDFTVRGQIMGDGFATAEVKITNAENAYAQQVNESSEFKFDKIVKGKYILALIGNDQELVIENLEIN
jgi:hypothetical protein